MTGRLSRFAADLAVWWLTSPGPRRARRTVRELGRVLTGSEHRVYFYHRVADPHSLIMLPLLAELQRRYQVVVVPRIILDVPIDIDPEPEARAAYLVMDARRLAAAWDMPFPESTLPPPESMVLLANRILLACADTPAFGDLAVEVTQAAWRADRHVLSQLAARHGALTADQAMVRVRRNQAEQRRRGHYSGAMLYHAGEWYGGLDRMVCLEDRLSALGARQDSAASASIGARFQPDRAAPVGDWRVLELFYSFRSPYSYLAVDRVFELAARFRIELVFRPVAPMVERGVPAPLIKRKYIVVDAAREARRLGVPFGRIRDPLGEAVRRCLALVTPATWAGHLREWLLSAGRAIWSEGADLADDAVLASAVHRAGLDPGALPQWLEDQAWREETDMNNARLRRIGLWGVPAFHLHDGGGRGGVVAWGQDRLWLLEQALMAASPASPSERA